jgi:hypothetical protein
MNAFSFPWNHFPSGTANPFFGRVRISSGKIPCIARLKMYLVVPFRSIHSGGMVAANSIRAWSRSGTRDSIEWAMLILSTLARMSSGR